MGSFSRKLKRAPNAGTINGLPSISAQLERFAQPLLEGLGSVADESAIQGLGALISLTWNMGGRPALPQDEQNVRSLLGMITGAAAGQAAGEPTPDAAVPVPDGEPAASPSSPEADQLKEAQEVMTTELMAMVERRRTLFGDDRRGVSGCTLHRRGKKGIELRATEGELASA
ncbi:MAG: hypothetical protein EOO75_07710 [Myxococcales bacterium]|nr:MAG: hypothetical protein EOO75_07710 [Myxococcales bacterium]